MSLINDALRKARREAAARGERPDAPELVVILPPKRSLAERPGVLLALGTAVVAAVFFGAGVAWWAVRRPAPVEPGVEASQQTHQPRPEEATPPAAEAAPPRSPAPTEARVAPAGSGAAGPEPTRIPQRGTSHSPAPPAAAPAVPTPTTVSSRHRSATKGPARGAPREFVGEAKLADVTLVLDYVVYRPSDPFVQINGVELHQGWEISGYTVTRIQTDRVVLEGPAGKVVIRAH